MLLCVSGTVWIITLISLALRVIFAPSFGTLILHFVLLIWQTERHFSESFSRTLEFIRRLIYCFVSSWSLLHGMMTLSGSCCLLALKVKLPSSLIPFSNLIHFPWTQIMLLLLISAWTRSYHCLGRPISVLADSCCEAMSDDVLTAAINVYSKTHEWKQKVFVLL